VAQLNVRSCGLPEAADIVTYSLFVPRAAVVAGLLAREEVTPMNRQWIYTAAPQGKLTTDIFELREIDIPEPGLGEVLVRNRYLNLMPGNRAYMHSTPVLAGLHLRPGQPMLSLAVGEVIASNDPAYAPGDVV
jgi:NADPH-dependent curcumin reductase CurA